MAASGTVIVALRYEGGVLIGADSQATDMAAGVRWSVTKLRQVGDHPFVLGFSGSMGAADRLLDALAAKNIDWSNLTDRVQLQAVLDEMFRPEYQAATRRNFPVGDVSGIAIWGLGAVHVANDFRILEYEMSGDSCWHEYFHAVGSGAQTAYSIYRAFGGRQLAGLRERSALLALLRIIRTSISVEMFGVGEPIIVWVVDGRGARRLSDDELNAHLQAADEWEAQERRRLFDADAPG